MLDSAQFIVGMQPDPFRSELARHFTAGLSTIPNWRDLPDEELIAVLADRFAAMIEASETTLQ